MSHRDVMASVRVLRPPLHIAESGYKKGAEMKQKNTRQTRYNPKILVVSLSGLFIVLPTMHINSVAVAEIHENESASSHLKELIKGSLKPLPGLEDGHLFNAENLALTTQGRLFVTGSKGAYEILRPDGVNYAQREIPITVDNVPTTCFRNGIASHGESLYLLCIHVHKGVDSDLEELCNVTDVEQTLWYFLFRGRNALKKCQIDSYLLRADLGAQRLIFSDGIALRPRIALRESIRIESIQKGEVRSLREDIKLFANGLAVDDKGVIYAANSSYDASEERGVGITRIEVNTTDPLTVTQSTWLRPEKGAPNGVEVKGKTLYYTDNVSLSGRLIKVAQNRNKTAEQRVYKKFWSVFDDFTTANGVFVIADFLNDSLRFVSQSGVLLGKFKHSGFEKPSSVVFVRDKNQLFEAGVILVTEKGRHRLSMLSR